MNTTVTRFAAPAGRLLLSLIFVMSAFGKISDPAGTMAYMKAQGMFAVPFFLAMAILFELGGGLSILLGWKARWGALALFVFLIPTTLIFHAFWAADPANARMQMINFMKNLSIMGGLLTVLAHGAGPFSLDARHDSRS